MLELRAPRFDEIDFDIVAVEDYELVASGGTEEVTEEGIIFNRHSDSQTDNLFYIEVIPVIDPRNLLGHHSIVVTGAGSLSGNNVVVRNADGEARVLVKTRWMNKAVTLTMISNGGDIFDEFISYADGSLAKNCYDQVYSRLSVEKEQLIFVTMDHVSSIYVRNPDCWVADVDMTCVTPWNSDGKHHKGGVAVSPRHVMFARHWKIANGSILRFVTMDNQVIERTLASTLDVSGGNNVDLTMGLLDSSLPESITPAKVCASDTRDKIPRIDLGIPILGTDREEKANVREWFSELQTDDAIRVGHRTITEGDAAPFSEDIVSGDSGNPQFLVINDELVLFSNTSTHAGGVAIWDIIDKINAAMTSLGGGYQLTEYDLSSFANYGA